MKISYFSLFLTMSVFAQYQTFTYESVTYGVFTANPSNVQLHWKNKDGNAYSNLGALKDDLQTTHNIHMLTNAGIYSKNYTPAGLWIENSQELQPLNTRNGTGNFHIQPNGVFLIDNQKAFVMPTENYQKAQITPQFAMQSGPMLIINGAINKRFKEKVFSPYIRNAVCTDKSGGLHFFMTINATENFPNFYDTSSALLKFGCYNALYLDGSISAWYIPNVANTFHWKPFVGMISVSTKK